MKRTPGWKPTKSGQSHYAKDKKSKEKTGKAKVLDEPIVVKKGVPLPPGIGDALKMMSILAQELDETVTTPHTVSIDVLNGKWILIVRGYDPPFDTYGGYEIRCIPSTFIRNPLAGSHSNKGRTRRR